MIEHVIAHLQPGKLAFLTGVLGIPQSVLAKRLGVTQQYLSMVKLGKIKLSMRTSKKLDQLTDQIITQLDREEERFPAALHELLGHMLDYGERL